MVSPWIIATGIGILAALAEGLQRRKVRRIRGLAFGPSGQPRPWTRLTPLLRVLSLMLLGWGLVTLYELAPRVHNRKPPEGAVPFRRVLLVLDVSPSMRIKDSGQDLRQQRSHRAAELMRSLMDRVLLDRIRFSIVAVYNGAMPVVTDTSDPEVVLNILNDLPMEQAFSPGKTQLIEGIKEAVKMADKWPPDSASLMVLTDGDTLPPQGMPQLPRAFTDALIIGVGNPVNGTFLDGHQSRQDRSALRQMARRLRGVYHDGNQRHLPTELLRQLSESLPMDSGIIFGRREWALLCCGLGGGIQALLPLLLTFFGLRRPPSRINPTPSTGALS